MRRRRFIKTINFKWNQLELFIRLTTKVTGAFFSFGLRGKKKIFFEEYQRNNEAHFGSSGEFVWASFSLYLDC